MATPEVSKETKETKVAETPVQASDETEETKAVEAPVQAKKGVDPKR